MQVFTTRLGGAVGSKPEDPDNFIGCLRDVTVNGNILVPSTLKETSVNIEPGCVRQAQCTQAGELVDIAAI